MDKSVFLQVALEAVKEAEKVILHYYSDEIRATLKEDQSPVTKADIEAEKIIVDIIKSKFPDHAFLGEESGASEKTSEYLWIIDPIDGTKNYMKKIPLFATQLALMKGDDLILGVSNAPELKELMYAEKDSGAYFNGNKVTVSSVSELDQAYVSFGSLRSFVSEGKLESLVNLSNKVQGMRGIGDFWSYHLLAQGKIEIMVEAKTKIWDIAALKVIVEEAGGVVTDILGNPIGKETTSIIATNKNLHREVIAYFKT